RLQQELAASREPKHGMIWYPQAVPEKLVREFEDATKHQFSAMSADLRKQIRALLLNPPPSESDEYRITIRRKPMSGVQSRSYAAGENKWVMLIDDALPAHQFDVIRH